MQSILGPLIDLLTWVLDWLYSIGLTWGQSIIGLTIIVRLILFPLTWKQYKSAQEMQAIQPQIKALQQKYKNDRGKLQEETMKLYQEHHVNPFASCLPLLLQLPIFISLYYSIRGEPQIADATFLTIPLGEPSIVLLVVYVVTQIISTELMLVTQTDQMQKMIMRAMPIIFVIFLWNFPAGLFVYWITTNLWTVGQQLIIRRTMPKPEEMAARAKAKPKKRSRFMEMMMASQSEAMKQREARLAEKSKGGASKQAGGASKQAGGGRKPAPGGKKPPPGKGKRKQGEPQGGKAGQPGARPKGSGGQKPKRRPADASSGGPSDAGGEGGKTTSPGGPAEQ
ncbi:MAG: YidC/Oxa1 family membrane protein insertase [Actinobacteria bacterium]|nr:YidC/Oxa1 family membrane protein insertase [Actinomycetota bacterium]